MRVMPTTTLGLDIGGANLKAATADGRAVSKPFALWKRPDQLGTALRSLLAQFDEIDEFAVTMTGELCDCFRTKREGVDRILSALESAADGRAIRVWGTDKTFHSAESARRKHMVVAAANWHALATYVARIAPYGNTILIDIGGTTTDIIPIRNGKPHPDSRTDAGRLKSGELVYTGVRRTPLCAILPPGCVAAELFATALDVWLMRGEIAENECAADTADARPETKEFARERLARMLGADGETLTPDDLADLLEQCVSWQTQLVRSAIQSKGRATPILSGEGEFLARRALAELDWPKPISLTQRLGAKVAACAPAHAVAVLASEKPR